MDWIVGVDEVGRGPLAGPVMVCVFTMPKSSMWFKSINLPLRDSKKLSAVQREGWLKEIKKAEKRGEAFYVVKSVGVKTIDKINIKQAADLAATRAFQQISLDIYTKYNKNKILKNDVATACWPGHCTRLRSLVTNLRHRDFLELIQKMEVISDAGLKINLPGLKQRSLPKADEKFPVVSLASIAAKVKRDKHMELLDKKYPGYGFAKNKGYGTAEHYRGLKRLGLSAIHRLTFTHISDKLSRK